MTQKPISKLTLRNLKNKVTVRDWDLDIDTALACIIYQMYCDLLLHVYCTLVRYCNFGRLLIADC